MIKQLIFISSLILVFCQSNHHESDIQCMSQDSKHMKVYLVTGGNRGIGLSIVEGISNLMGEEDVMILNSRGDDGQEEAKKFRQNLKKNIVFHHLEVTSDESVRVISDWIQSQYGHLDVLINNAGYAIKGEAFNEEIATTTIGINYFGVVRVCEALLPLMGEKSRIINVSSGMGIIDKSYSDAMQRRLLSETINPQELNQIYQEFLESIRNDEVFEKGFPRSTYRVSKVLMNAYSRYLYRTVGISRNIFIATVDPGWVRTRMGGNNAPLSSQEGADTIVWMATEPLENLKNGEYWYKRKTRAWSK